jgi:hypothetical protein
MPTPANEFLAALSPEQIKKLPKVDQEELTLLKNFLAREPDRANQFADDYRFRREFQMFVFELMTPNGEAVFTEFNFRDEASAKLALDAVHILAPDRYE